MGLKYCKLSSLNPPGTETPYSVIYRDFGVIKEMDRRFAPPFAVNFARRPNALQISVLGLGFRCTATPRGCYVTFIRQMYFCT